LKQSTDNNRELAQTITDGCLKLVGSDGKGNTNGETAIAVTKVRHD